MAWLTSSSGSSGSSRRSRCLASALGVVSFSNPFYSALVADREPRLARGALPAALRRVRRGGAGARLRRRGDGDVPVRDRLPRRPHRRVALVGRAVVADRRRRPRGRRDPRRGAASSSGSRAGGFLSQAAAHHARVRLAGSRSAACSSPTTCSRSRSPRSCCSSPPSAASCSARTRGGSRAMHGPDIALVRRPRRAALLDRRARRDAAPQPADHPALASRSCSTRRNLLLIAFSRLHGQRGRPGLRDLGDGGRRLRGRRRARPDRRDGPPPRRARRRQAQDAARIDGLAR